MVDGADQAKKDNPRYEKLTGGHALDYYLARRYFHYEPHEWDALPWWQSLMYIEGLEASGILGDGKSKRSDAGEPGTSAPRPVDYAEDSVATLPRGFTTRRAG